MRPNLPTRLLATFPLLALALAPAGGCVAFYGHRDVTATVHDAETGRPIAGAEVGVHYLYMLTFNAPRPASAVTGPDGTATVRAANFEAEEWSASAEGYLPDRLPPTYDGRWRTAVAFRLYRAPAAAAGGP